MAIIVVDDLAQSGLPRRAAFAIGAALCEHFIRVVADENYRPFVVIWPDADTAIGQSFRIASDASIALEVVLAHPLATLLNVHDAVRSALVRLLDARHAAKDSGR